MTMTVECLISFQRSYVLLSQYMYGSKEDQTNPKMQQYNCIIL